MLFVRLPFRALGLATWQVNFLVSTFLVAFLAERSVTYLNYAYRINHLPAGLFGAAIGSVALVELSAQASADSLEGVKEQMRHGLRLVTVIMLPLAAMMIALAVPVVRVIYQHGRFSPENTVATAQALMLYSTGVWAPAAARCVASGFYALKDTKTPAITGLIAVAFCIGSNLLLMHRIGFLSFAMNTALAQMIDFVVLLLLFRNRAGPIGVRGLAGLMLKVLAISVAAGGAGVRAVPSLQPTGGAALPDHAARGLGLRLPRTAGVLPAGPAVPNPGSGDHGRRSFSRRCSGDLTAGAHGARLGL